MGVERFEPACEALDPISGACVATRTGGKKRTKMASEGGGRGKKTASGIDRPRNDRHVKFGFRWKRAQVK